MNLTFSGGGFLTNYELGVAVGLVDHAPELVKNLNSVSAASAGCFAAFGLLLCPTKLKELASTFIEICSDMHQHSFGLLHPKSNVPKLIQETMIEFIPENAHNLASNKLHISLTNIKGLKSDIISTFESKEDLMKCLHCACFIPMWSGFLPPYYRDQYYMDGSFTNNIPMPYGVDATVTITVDPGLGIISPGDVALYGLCERNRQILTKPTLSFECMVRSYRCLIPLSRGKMQELYQQGYDDALEFLRKHYYSLAIPSNVLHYNCRVYEKPICGIKKTITNKNDNDDRNQDKLTRYYLLDAIKQAKQWIPDDDRGKLDIKLDLLQACVEEAQQKYLHLQIRHIILRPCLNNIEIIMAILLRILALYHQFYNAINKMLKNLNLQFGDLSGANRFYSESDPEYLKENHKQDYQSLVRLGSIVEIFCHENINFSTDDSGMDDLVTNAEAKDTFKRRFTSSIDAFTAIVDATYEFDCINPFLDHCDTNVKAIAELIINLFELMDIALVVYLYETKPKDIMF